jgi:uncharacterized protein YxjI
MNYPLQLSFKILAIAQQVSMTDSSGAQIAYVKQKAFKLKEDVQVFADKEQTRLLFTVKADRILDFNARYQFADAQGNPLGSVKRQGMKSLWKTHYDIMDQNDMVVLSINEENAWIKVWDAVLGEIPIIGIFTGYLFNPAYLITRPDGSVILRLAKKPAFLEGKFELQKKGEPTPDEETRALLGMLMMLLLERGKG